jgi:uncharacterized protein DUF1653
MSSEFRPGLYKHYKGPLYYALGLVTHHDTRNPMVVYFSQEKEIVTVRPLRGWEIASNPTSAAGLPIADTDGWLDRVVVFEVAGEVGRPWSPAKTTVPRFEFVRPMTPDEADCATAILGNTFVAGMLGKAL